MPLTFEASADANHNDSTIALNSNTVTRGSAAAACYEGAGRAHCIPPALRLHNALAVLLDFKRSNRFGPFVFGNGSTSSNDTIHWQIIRVDPFIQVG
jgi:hypothetical protein